MGHKQVVLSKEKCNWKCLFVTKFNLDIGWNVVIENTVTLHYISFYLITAESIQSFIIEEGVFTLVKAAMWDSSLKDFIEGLLYKQQDVHLLPRKQL